MGSGHHFGRGFVGKSTDAPDRQAASAKEASMCEISLRRIRLALSVMLLAGVPATPAGTGPAPSQQGTAAPTFGE
jgi:hypothetical protein